MFYEGSEHTAEEERCTSKQRDGRVLSQAFQLSKVELVLTALSMDGVCVGFEELCVVA